MFFVSFCLFELLFYLCYNLNMADIKFISVQSDIASVQKSFKELGLQITKSALPQSLNQIGSKAFTKSVSVTSRFLGVPAKNLRHGSAGKAGGESKPMMTTKKAQASNLRYEIKVKSRWLHLSEKYFKPKQNKGGVESIYHSNYNANPSGGRMTYLGAFIGKGKFSNKPLVYLASKTKFKMVQGKRKMIKRPILKALWAFNPAREFIAKGVGDAILNEFAPQIKKRYEDKLNQYIARHKSKMKKM
jgi:hypothetical protein